MNSKPIALTLIESHQIWDFDLPESVYVTDASQRQCEITRVVVTKNDEGTYKVRHYGYSLTATAKRKSGNQEIYASDHATHALDVDAIAAAIRLSN